MALPDKDLQTGFDHDTFVGWLTENGFGCTPHKDAPDKATLCSSQERSVKVVVPKQKGVPFTVEHEDGPFKDACATAPLMMTYSPRRTQTGRNHMNVASPLGTCSVQTKRTFGFQKKYLTP